MSTKQASRAMHASHSKRIYIVVRHLSWLVFVFSHSRQINQSIPSHASIRNMYTSYFLYFYWQLVITSHINESIVDDQLMCACLRLTRSIVSIVLAPYLHYFYRLTIFVMRFFNFLRSYDEHVGITTLQNKSLRNIKFIFHKNQTVRKKLIQRF